MTETADHGREQTYWAMRLAPPLLLLVLGIAIWVERHQSGLWQTSISEYYHTASGLVFVGVLCAVGACMIAYHGNSHRENWLLDIAGFMAFVVAFAPIPYRGESDQVAVTFAGVASWSPVRTHVLILGIVGLLALGIGWVEWWLFLSRQLEQKDRKWVIGGLIAATLLLTAGFVYFLYNPERLDKRGHGIAAAVLFVFIWAVVIDNACGRHRQLATGGGQRRKAWYWHLRALLKNWYFWLSVTMPTSAVLIAWREIPHFEGETFRHWLFWVESAVIFQFFVFWIIQTVELRGYGSRDQAIAAKAKQDD